MRSRNPDLEQLIRNEPDDAANYLVYADWLLAHDNPHGELIQLQHTALSSPRDVDLRRRESELLEQHAVEWVGEQLAGDVHMLSWWCGFVTEAPSLTLLDMPAGIAVRSIDIGRVSQAVVDRLASLSPPLRSLRLSALPPYPPEQPPLELAALWRSLPPLQSIELEGLVLTLGRLRGDRLRALNLLPLGLRRDHLEDVASAELPLLEHFELWCEARQRSRWGELVPVPNAPPMTDVTLADVAQLVRGRDFAQLRHLAIVNGGFGDELCEVVVGLACATTLVKLDLRTNQITDRGVTTLLDHRSAFPALRQVRLGYNRINDRQAAKQLCHEVLIERPAD